jgi:hypothetical protein
MSHQSSFHHKATKLQSQLCSQLFHSVSRPLELERKKETAVSEEQKRGDLVYDEEKKRKKRKTLF